MRGVKSCLPWVGGKSKLLWLIHRLFPDRREVGRFIDVFGGSGTVLMSRPVVPGCLEVYNDFNHDLTNLFFCVKNRTMALLMELGFLPLNSRDDFNVLYKFFSKEEFTGDYLEDELELSQVMLEPPQYEAVKRLLTERAAWGDVRRASDYYKLVRCSFSSGAKSFAGKACDIRRFFHLVWECSRRLAGVVIENRDYAPLVRQYDRPDAFFYCDPPYYEAEGCYAVVFTLRDHVRLHRVLAKCNGFVMVSYNDHPLIVKLYSDFFIFRTTRPNSMSQTPGSEYVELVMTNYDPREYRGESGLQLNLFSMDEDAGNYTLIHEPEKPLKTKERTS